MKLVAQGERSGRREYPIKLTVSDPKDCAYAMVGNYTKSSYCTGSTGNTQSVTADGSIRNRVVFANIDGSGTNIYADVDCDSYYGGYQISIPVQTSNGKTYNGSGNIYYNSPNVVSEIRLSLYQTNGGSYCTYTLSR